MNILIDYFKTNNIPFNDQQIDKFDSYFKLLIEWNQKFNLTAITQSHDVQIKHFIDSLAALNLIKDSDSIVDVGAGAGFPSIPLAIMQPNASFCLIDSLNKRVTFLNAVKDALCLKNVAIHHARAEDFAKNNRSKFDISIARAVAPMNVLLEYLAPLAKRDGTIIAYKGGAVNDEITLASNAVSALKLSQPQITEFCLPTINDKRYIVVFKKLSECNKIYPRAGNKPRLQPL